MERKTIKNILDFLKEKEGKKFPQGWFDYLKKLELIKELENHPDDIQYRYEGNLVLSSSVVKKLPNDLYVNGYFDLTDCKKIRNLPDKLYVKSSLYLEGCKELINLPYKLHVGRNLLIGDTPLANRYTDEEIKDIVTSTGGEIIGLILR